MDNESDAPREEAYFRSRRGAWSGKTMGTAQVFKWGTNLRNQVVEPKEPIDKLGIMFVRASTSWTYFLRRWLPR